MADRVKNKVVIVTGGAQGIGYGCAEMLAREGAHVIIGDRNSVSIKSRQQPLFLVVNALGETLGVPIEMKYEAPDLIDADIRSAPTEDAILRLSPLLRLYVRADLGRVERKLLRLVVVRADAK